MIFDTPGRLPYDTARRMLRPGPYTAFMGKPNSDDLQRLADAAGRGDITTRIQRTVRLADAIPALVDLETAPTSSAGRLVITAY